MSTPRPDELGGAIGRFRELRRRFEQALPKVAPTPAFVRFGARVSEEGGSDVPADWARGGA